MRQKLNTILNSKVLSIILMIIFIFNIGAYIYLEKSKNKSVVSKEENKKIENKAISNTNTTTTLNTQPINNSEINSEIFIAQSGGHDSGSAISLYVYSISDIEKGKYKKIEKKCMSEELYKKYSTKLPGINYSEYNYDETVKTVINDKKVIAQVLLNTRIATDHTLETSNRTSSRKNKR